VSGGKTALIAGGGDLPVKFLENVLIKNREIIVFAVDKNAGRKSRQLGFETYDIAVTRLGEIIKKSVRLRVKKTVILGYVDHRHLLKNINFDFRSLKALWGASDWRAGSIMRSIIREIEKSGIKVISPATLLSGIIAEKGVMGRVKPGKKEMAEVEFAYKMAQKLSAADIGQTVIVKRSVVVAAEAQEGTDLCIIRGAKTAGKGFIIAKAARPGQDMRFDVPVIGPATISLAVTYGAKGIAVSAGKTFLINKSVIIKDADRRGIFIIGM